MSERGQYGFLDGTTTGGINGGVGGGARHEPHVVFYVGVPDVEATLGLAQRLGGTRRLGPADTPGQLVVGQFTDPAGNLVGIAGER